MSHWYDRETGHLLPDVELKVRPGEWREANLADARKVLALPSVTGILSILSKPALTRWQIEQGIKAALDTAIMEPEATGMLLATDAPLLYKELVHKAEEFVHWTADYGTAVHAHLSSKLSGIPLAFPPIMPRSEEGADFLYEWLGTNGFEVELTEYHFVAPMLGWGGTIDIMGSYYGEPMIADIKTQSEPIYFHEPDYPLQLSGYSLGCDLSPDVKRISVILDRDNFNVKYKLWQDNERWDAMFKGLFELWTMLNRYDPRIIE